MCTYRPGRPAPNSLPSQCFREPVEQAARGAVAGGTSESAPRGVLTAGDRWIVEIAARLMAEYRKTGRVFRVRGLLTDDGSRAAQPWRANLNTGVLKALDVPTIQRH
jgi:hypothetical protein